MYKSTSLISACSNAFSEYFRNFSVYILFSVALFLLFMANYFLQDYISIPLLSLLFVIVHLFMRFFIYISMIHVSYFSYLGKDMDIKTCLDHVNDKFGRYFGAKTIYTIVSYSVLFIGALIGGIPASEQASMPITIISTLIFAAVSSIFLLMPYVAALTAHGSPYVRTSMRIAKSNFFSIIVVSIITAPPVWGFIVLIIVTNNYSHDIVKILTVYFSAFMSLLTPIATCIFTRLLFESGFKSDYEAKEIHENQETYEIQ